ncbi:MAG TPA: tetratricopeptide repeat protein [Burkholderiaceae bacterium]|nr:tetratricopeptide repeat protein [Burkholderiaceae bacterium]
MTDELSALRRKLQQIEARHTADDLADDAYAAEKSRLERALVDRVLTQPGADGAPARPSKRFVASLAAAVLAVAGVGYWWTGSPGLAGAGAAATASASDSAAQSENERKFAQAVEELAAKMKEHPEQAEGWALLARSYVRLGQVEPALAAFQKAVALRDDDPALLVDYADVLAVANGRKLEGEPTRLIERALKLDPDHLKALSLAGAAAFDRKDFAGAAQYWERVVKLSPPTAPYLPELQSGIDEARRQGGLAPRATASADAPRPAAPTPPAAAAAIRGTVSLSPSVAGKAAADDTVFIYARAADGPRMPLAIVRLQVRDLPAAFTLDDSSAMSPAARLSTAPRVIVSARVSKSGQATPSRGDLVGETPAMANHADGVALEIDEVVKN